MNWTAGKWGCWGASLREGEAGKGLLVARVLPTMWVRRGVERVKAVQLKRRAIGWRGARQCS